MGVPNRPGCASAPIERALPSAEISNILNAKVYLIIEKEDLQAQTRSSTAGKDFGLIGMFLDSYQDSQIYKEMKDKVAPLNTAAKGFDYNAMIINGFKKSGIFKKGNKIEYLKNPPTDEEERAIFLYQMTNCAHSLTTQQITKDS